ncbi:MAG: hypothetical protein IPP19_10170 [Verrucomicrobia bacterium]|nr:hypothetical protein [Verrucomicrobiota bacterium]
MQSPQHKPTAEEVLAIIVDEHRHGSAVDPEADPDAKLGFETTIAEWRDACDLLAWRKLGLALNKSWEITLSVEEWRNLLEPAEIRTLRGVCEAISSKATISHISDIGFFGCVSPEGRAMRAIRSQLIKLGVPRSEIRKSTQITPILDAYGSSFLTPFIRMAPGALPKIAHIGWVHHTLLMTAGGSLFIGGVLAVFQVSLGTWLICLAILSMLLLAIPHRLFRGCIVLPGIQTLADLAIHLGKSL